MTPAPLDDAALPPPRIHPTAEVEAGATVGAGTAIWAGAHVRSGARIGRQCIVGERTYIAYEVAIGDLVKLNAGVYVCARVTIEDGVLVAAHTVFTNDNTPRACDPDLQRPFPSAPTAATLATTVRRGASIGANCTIGPGLELGAFCMVGMGSVVTRDVPPHALVLGNPARLRGLVCRCGAVVVRCAPDARPRAGPHRCGACARTVPWPPAP
jgi:acetyltransferase-like isoleucine patch superfamily enzyme